MPQLKDDSRFADITARKHNMDALYEIVEPLFSDKTVTEWLEIFATNDVPSAPVNTVGEALECDQAQAREIVFDYEHSLAGKVAHRLVRRSGMMDVCVVRSDRLRCLESIQMKFSQHWISSLFGRNGYKRLKL